MSVGFVSVGFVSVVDAGTSEECLIEADESLGECGGAGTSDLQSFLILNSELNPKLSPTLFSGPDGVRRAR